MLSQKVLSHAVPLKPGQCLAVVRIPINLDGDSGVWDGQVQPKAAAGHRVWKLTDEAVAESGRQSGMQEVVGR